MHIDRRGTNDKNEKVGQRVLGRGHVTYFLNFGTSYISRELFELETSNLACRLTTGSTKWKIRSKGVGKGSRDLLFKFWDTLHIPGTV